MHTAGPGSMRRTARTPHSSGWRGCTCAHAGGHFWHRCHGWVTESRAGESRQAHVEQEKRSPLEQHPSAARRLPRGHSIPLLSAIHHLSCPNLGCLTIGGTPTLTGPDKVASVPALDGVVAGEGCTRYVPAPRDEDQQCVPDHIIAGSKLQDGPDAEDSAAGCRCYLEQTSETQQG